MGTNSFGKRCFFIILALILFCTAFILPAYPAVKSHTKSGTIYKKDHIDLSQKDIIFGTITDSNTKRAIGGAVVELKNANFGLGYYRVKTDSSGNFRIDDFIKHVTYKMEISAEGYVTYQHTAATQPGKFDFSLQREGIISGIVTDSAGQPLSGVEVRMDNANHPNQDNENRDDASRPLLVTTDKKGYYRFNKLAPDSYVTTFQKPGFIKETAQIRQIKNGETLSLPMQLFRPASIAGKVMIKGMDIPAANIDITFDGAQTYSAVTYQDGSFSIDDIKPGNYKLSLSHRGFHGTETKPITIKEGENKKNFNYALVPKKPAVEVYSDRYTFVLGQQLGFNVKTFRLEKVKVKLYRLPMELVLRGRTDSDKIEPEKEGLQKIREWNESIKDFTAYEWREQYIDVAEALPPGGYCIEAAGENNVLSRKFFSVTSVGIVVKRSLNSVFVYATDLALNKPISGASIILFDITPKVKVKPANEPPEAPAVTENDGAEAIESAGGQEEGAANDERNDDQKKTYTYNPPARLEDLPINIMVKGKTDGNGIFQIPVPSGQAVAVMAVGPDSSYAFCHTGTPTEFNQEKDKLFIYTDRPVYRAGDKVHYKIIGKTMGEKSISLGIKKLFYQIKNTDVDEKADSGSFLLDVWGSYNSELNLSPEARLGTYEIRVGTDENNLYGLGKFFVDQYRKPEFKIEISSIKEYFINRDTVEFKVEAKYLFGSPLKGALVRYRFYESKLRDNEAKYWWEEDQEQSRTYNKIKLEGDKNLDENGVALLKLSSGDLPYDRELTLEVTIVDKSNISLSESSTVKVGRGDYYIKIKPGQSFYAEDEKKRIEIKTVSHNGQPQSTAVDIKVYRYLWKSWQRVYVHDKKPYFAAKVHTDASGVAKFELPAQFDLYGEFDIVAESKDKKNNIITASRVIWIYGNSAAKVESRFKNLELTASETALEKPGEITCLLKSRYTDSYVCLTVEGKDIFEKKVVKMSGNILPVKFNIKAEYAPNVFITATMQHGRALFTSSVEVTLPNSDVAMNIALSPSKEKYLPGEKIKIDIKATDEAGKPVAGDISLGVVDEAIYLIRRDHTPKMRDFFYSKNSNWVLTNYSYPFTILAGVGKDGKVKVREKFADTAYWKADIRTDKQGMAKVDFILPDNLTTWRLTARGHDLLGRVGEKKNTVLVTQDLIARIGKPRFFIEGDRIGLLGIINSNAGRGLPSVKTEFKVDNATVEREEKIKLSLPAHGVASSYYNIKIPDNKKSMDLFFQTVGDAEANDALKVNVPVYSRGVSYKLYGAGDMSANKTIELAPPKDTGDFDYKPEEMTISVSPSPILQLLRGTDYLANFPYGCIEQTINGFLPALALRNLLSQKGLNIARNEKLDEKIAAGIAKIQGYQNPDGTWGWWGSDSGNEFITGYVLYSLHLARSFGFTVNKYQIDKALDAVEKTLNATVVNDDDARAFLFYTYSLWNKWHDRTFNALIYKSKLNTYCRAFLIMAMAGSEKIDMNQLEKAKIKNLLPLQVMNLKNLQRRDNYGIYWEHEGNQLWGWPGGNTEITAHVLAALAAVHDTSPLPAQVINSLMRRSRGGAWKSTKETATVIFSVCKYYQERGWESSGKGKIFFKMDGIRIAAIDYNAGTLENADKLTRKIRMAQVNRNSFKIEAAGSTDPGVSFTVTINGNLYFKENVSRHQPKSNNATVLDFAKHIAGGVKNNLTSYLKAGNRSLKSLDNGISLVRSFYYVTRVRDINNNEYFVPQPIDNTRGLKIGDEVLVKIKFRVMDDFQFLVLEDYLPSGFEVVKKNIYDEYQPYSHSERWDNRMVFFFTKISKNDVYEIGYTMRAELPGLFLAKPARMECMYEPGIQGWSKQARFIVNKK